MSTDSTAPISFTPLPQERVWGGRRFASLEGKAVPEGAPLGELWEIVDRPEAQSIVASGPDAGRTLHDLWSKENRAATFGAVYENHPAERFPILVKLLDARERLSLQVHPPASIAPDLDGEPKTEVWYFLQSDPDASIYAGIKRGTSRDQFCEALRSGAAEHLTHHLAVKTGESIFIPSGRLHAIGGGNLIVEIQQNSDTTYRVFDWNRVGLDGKSRELHIEESLASIDFEDVEPKITPAATSLIADCEFFRVEKRRVSSPFDPRPRGRFCIVTVTNGSVICDGRTFPVGQCLLAPATGRLILQPESEGTEVLVTTLPVS